MTDHLAKQVVLLCLDRLGEIQRDYSKAKTEIEIDLGERLRAAPYTRLIDGFIIMLAYWRDGGSTAELTEQSAILRFIADAIELVPYAKRRIAGMAGEESLLAGRKVKIAQLLAIIQAVSDE